jgi:hypothetical protein
MKDMHVFERDVNGRRYRIAAQSIWDPVRGRSVARQVVLGPASPAPVAECAEHVRQLEGESPFHNLMEVK